MAIGIVTTKFGKMSGVEYEGKYAGITNFMGVPYAAPPVGDLRWKPPVDPAPWDGVRVCDKCGNIPMQQLPDDPRYTAEFTFKGVPPMSEDCLYMDICTPAQGPGEKLPVYMWFHGGGLSNCYAYEAECDPCEFAKQGVITILVEQRLNIFGYMALPQLSAEQGGKSGNYGLMDQIKALDWVYENIEAFGGDPENITVGGQSGGTQKALSMTATPKSRGRVKRVINESGLKWLQKYPTVKEAEEKGSAYLEFMGIDPNTPLEELRKLDAEKLRAVGPAMKLRGKVPATLIYDEEWVPCPNFVEAFDKYLDGVDIMSGTNLGEAVVNAAGNAGLNTDPALKPADKIDSAEAFYAHYKFLLGPLYEKYDFENLVKVTDETAYMTSMRLASCGLAGAAGMNISRNVMIDRIFGSYMAKRYPENNIYSYLFAYMMPIKPEHEGTIFDPKIVGAWHSSEMWFAFNSIREGVPPHRPWEEKDFDFAKLINTYWANFIRSGDPNGEGLPVWPKSDESYSYAELADPPVMVSGLDTKLDQLIYEFTTLEYADDLKEAGAI